MNDHVTIVGCGRTGCIVIKKCMETMPFPRVDFIAIDTDEENLLQSGCPNQIIIDEHFMDILDAKPGSRIKKITLGDTENMIHTILIKGQLLITVCGLGDDNGPLIASYVGEIALNVPCLRLALAPYPSSIEGNGSIDRAKKGLVKLKQNMNTVITVPIEEIYKTMDNLSIDIIYETANGIMVHILRRLSETLVKQNLMALDVCDLCSIFKIKKIAMVGVGRCESFKEIDKGVVEALNSSLLDVDFREEAEELTVLITGGPDLLARQAEIAMSEIHDRCNPQTFILWSARADKEMGEAVEVMVIFVRKS